MSVREPAWASSLPDFSLAFMVRTLTATCLIGMAHGVGSDAELASDAADCMLEDSSTLRVYRSLFSELQGIEPMGPDFELDPEEFDNAVCLALATAFSDAGDDRWLGLLEKVTVHDRQADLYRTVMDFMNLAGVGSRTRRPRSH